IEGPTLVGEALDAKVPLEAVLVAPGADVAIATRAAAAGAMVHELDEGVLERVSDAVTPQPVVAVAPFVDVPLEAVRGGSLVVVCVDVRDPGNLGTVLRSAEAAGADAVVCCEGSVDVYSPKTVR